MVSELRILILGAGGFVGGHFVQELSRRSDLSLTLLPTSIKESEDRGIKKLDITDVEAVRVALKEFKPSHVVNLAGLAAPAVANRDRRLAWTLHAETPEAVGRLILSEAPHCWFFNVGTGLVYGRTAISVPVVNEESLPVPIDSYAVTKAAGDLALGALVQDGLKCVRLRPFNHTGPGQSTDFALPAFAAQLARIAKGGIAPEIRVGNLEAERDFLDVRDVVRAYVSLVLASEKLVSGSIYNVSSGYSVSIKHLLTQLIEISGQDVLIINDPERQRPSDVPRIAGDSSRLQRDTGWQRAISIEQTLSDLYAFYKGKY